MAKITGIHFDRATRETGCTCDKCGQWIQNIWTVSFDDNTKFHYGIDCFEKMTQSGKLTKVGENLLKKTMKSIAHYEEQLALWSTITEAEAEEKGLLTNLRNESWNTSYWAGRSFQEYRDWQVNEFFPYRIAEEQKVLKKFEKVNFEK